MKTFACLATVLGAASLQPTALRASPQATEATTKSGKKDRLLVDPKLPVYEPKAKLAGQLDSIGSDTLNNLMTLWTEGFHRFHPRVRVQVEGKGSATAPPALIKGTAQLGPMSRKMKPSELEKFEKRFGYPPTRVRVAIDALAVYVNKDNPIDELTLREVDAIFSKARRGGLPRPIRQWAEIGAAGRFAGKRIRCYGRNSASGTYAYFKKIALFKGDFADHVKEQPGSASVVRSVGEDLFGIGYSGIGYRTSDVKVVRLAKKKGGPWFGTDPKTVLGGKYPLARFLYIYVNKAPGKPLDLVVREFLRYVGSRQGQTTVVGDGYLPLAAKVVASDLATLD